MWMLFIERLIIRMRSSTQALYVMLTNFDVETSSESGALVVA